VTGGMLTHMDDHDNIRFEIFEPSETLAGGEVLSLEEKFLAGEGQNITPARFGSNTEEYNIIAAKVKKDLEGVARVLNIEGYCRIDAFVKVSQGMHVETTIIEVNSLPGMTPATVIFHQAAINGYKPYEFIDKILEFSFKKNRVELH
jgi:D-alanine-D-alanine ligase